MEFNSPELKNAFEVNSSITYEPPTLIDLNKLRDSLKVLIITKDQSLLKSFEFAEMARSNSSSGLNTFKVFLNLLRDYLTMKYREDNVKNISIRKNIDIMCLSLETAMINGIDISSDEVNSIMLGFLSKNFV